MNTTASVIVYYIAITVGYVWAVVQFAAGEPFDGWVLGTITLMFNVYRNTVVDQMKPNDRRDQNERKN